VVKVQNNQIYLVLPPLLIQSYSSSVRYPDVFTTPQKSAFELKTRCEEMIDKVLKDSSISGIKMNPSGKKTSSHRDKKQKRHTRY
jgi:hypothetical protein